MGCTASTAFLTAGRSDTSTHTETRPGTYVHVNQTTYTKTTYIHDHISQFLMQSVFAVSVTDIGQ